MTNRDAFLARWAHLSDTAEFAESVDQLVRESIAEYRHAHRPVARHRGTPHVSATHRTHIVCGDDYESFLVECRSDGIALYLSLDVALNVVWVEEADDALHFSRRSDAERMIDNASDEMDLRIVDHRWVGGVPRDRVVRWCEK